MGQSGAVDAHAGRSLPLDVDRPSPSVDGTLLDEGPEMTAQPCNPASPLADEESRQVDRM